MVGLASAPTLVANSVGFALGFVVSFLGHFHLTFASPVRRSPRSALPRFLFTATFSFGLNTIAVWTVVEYLGWHYFMAVAIMIIPIPILVFLTGKYWAFRQPRAIG
jgi:putative flippase GtrA